MPSSRQYLRKPWLKPRSPQPLECLPHLEPARVRLTQGHQLECNSAVGGSGRNCIRRHRGEETVVVGQAPTCAFGLASRGDESDDMDR